MSALVQSKEALHFKIKYVPHFNQCHISFSRGPGHPLIQRHHFHHLRFEREGASGCTLRVNRGRLFTTSKSRERRSASPWL